MRTAQRDQGGTITCSAPIVDAPSGSGVLQPGAIPFTFVRINTGTYQVRTDTRLIPIAAVANVVTGGYIADVINFSAGSFSVNVVNNTFAQVNGNTTITATYLDKRT